MPGSRAARGNIRRIGGQALLTMERAGEPTQRTALPVRDHRAAIEVALHWIGGADLDPATDDEEGSLVEATQRIDAVGHRVVHGGERFTSSVLIDDVVYRRSSR